MIYYFYDGEPVPFYYLSPTRQVGELPIPYTTTMSPSGYVEFAIQDLASDSPRGYINAFSNVKRAIHLLIDSLLNQYGLFFHFRSANFPTKLQLLDEVGLLPIGIMTNLNVERNLLEHEYSTPTKQRVQEAVDVAKLLLLATEKLLEKTPQEVLAGWRAPKRQFLLRLESPSGRINLFGIWTPKHYRKRKSLTHVDGPIRTLRGDEYHSWVKIAKVPWKTIPLDRTHKNDWVPIIKELVNLQRRSTLHQTIVTRDLAWVSMMVTLPLSLPGNLTWSEVLDNAVKKEYQKQLQNSKDVNAPSESQEGAAPPSAEPTST
jgi:hypothetical protein